MLEGNAGFIQSTGTWDRWKSRTKSQVEGTQYLFLYNYTVWFKHILFLVTLKLLLPSLIWSVCISRFLASADNNGFIISRLHELGLLGVKD